MTSTSFLYILYNNLTLYSSRKSFPSSAERIRYSSSRLSTGMGKYVLEVDGDRGSKTTVCCSVEECNNIF